MSMKVSSTLDAVHVGEWEPLVEHISGNSHIIVSYRMSSMSLRVPTRVMIVQPPCEVTDLNLLHCNFFRRL